MGGKKSGGSSHTPVEAKETGRSYQVLRMLEVISEGEIEGLVDDMRSVYLDKTPLCNKDGSFNFKNVSIYANAGTQDQDVLQEFNSVEKEIEVGTKVLKDKPLIRTITDVNVNRIRMTLGVERLMKQEDNGDTNPTSVSMTVEVLKNNQVQSTYTHIFTGKYSNTYREMFDLVVPKPPFSIRVSRVQPDSLTNKLSNNCFWASYTEIIDQQFAYPNTALVGIKIDSEYFSNIPVRNYEVNGLIVKVPNNYDAKNHKYTSDFWDGSFKNSWTNNPAWVFYDLVTNTRYGMGKRLQDFGIDKWQLYAIGRYCDELVPDGFGGTEPRMTCNIWITDQRKAYDLINDICSIFRAMPVWNGQALTAIQDRKADPVWTYNNANTIGGFTRQRSARKARHNVIQVEYVDAEDFYEKKVESVSDDLLVARYGQNVKKITAFGCTSRGQAYRTGRWLLETEKLETETITFTVGQEGVMHLPYDVIEVADSQYAGVNVGGRVLAVNGTKLTLDRTIEVDDNSYLSYVSAKGVTENVKIISFDKQTNIVTVGKNLNGIPELTVWGLSTKRITTGLYRAISIKENDNSDGKTYTITALQHVPEKEDIVTNGTHFDPKPTTIYGDVIDAEINYDGSRLTVNGKVNGSFNVLSSNNVASYTVKLLKDGTLVYIEKGLATPDIKVDDLENGNYEAQISAYNDKGQLLKQYTKSFVINRPPLVTGISVTGHLSSVILTWNFVDDTTQTEIWCSERNDINTATLVERITGIYYAHAVGAKKVRYYWLRHKRGVNVGSFDQIQGRKGESGVDIQAELDVLNKELGKNIINEIIDTALPARKLGMTLYVDKLDVNKYAGQKQVYDETTNKTYTWNGTKYVPLETELLAEKIKGIIQPSQLAAIPTKNLAGKLTDAQIESINATKLIGTVNISQVPSIPTSKLTGLLTNAQIQALDASKLQGTVALDRLPTVPTTKLSGQITDAQLTAVSASKISGTIDISKIPEIPTTMLGGQLTDEQIKSVNATKIAGVIGVNQIASIPTTKLTGTITEAQIASLNASKVNGVLNINSIPNVPTSKLSGTIGANQISANAIGANAIQAGVIGASHIRANSIGAEKLQANSVGTNALQAGVVTAEKIGANAIDASKIKANSIGANHLGANAVTAEKISAGAINSQKIASNAIEGTHIKANAIGANHITAGSITSEKILANAITAVKIAGNSITGDKIQANSISGDKLQANSIEGSKIKANTIDGNHIKAQSIVAGKLASGSILADNIASNAITAPKIATGAITAEKLSVNSVGANAIQAGAITAQKLGASSVDAGKIKAGAINSNHIQAGQISADKLAIGLGGNLFQNPIFANNGNGWTLFVNTPQIANTGWSFNRNTGDYQGYGYLETENQFHWQAPRTNSDASNVRFGGLYQDLKLVKGRYYCFSAYVGGHRSFQDLNIEQGAVQIIKKSWTGRGKNSGYGAGAGITSGVEEERRIYMIFKANGNANQNYRFIINQWAEGAQQNPMMKIRRPMLEECTEHTQAPSAWVNAGVTSIHGGSIVTNSITADKIGANQITANHIVAGAIHGDKIAGNTITGDKIVAGSITTAKMSVDKLSSINANLGSITAGSIRIGSINGAGHGTFFEVNAQGGFRLVSRDGSGGIELSSGSRALKVWNGAYEVVRVGKLTG